MPMESMNLSLPQISSNDESFYERLRSFIKQYESILEARAQATGKYFDAEAKRKTVITESYIYSPGHCEPLSRKEISQIIGSSQQTVSNKREDFCILCRNILINGVTDEGISADAQLVEDIRSISNSIGNTVTLQSFDDKTGITDAKTRLFFCDLLGMRISDDKQYTQVVSQKSVNAICEKLDILLSYFRRNVINIRYKEDVLPFLRKTFDTELAEAFDSLICHSKEFIWKTIDGTDYVALRWDLLRDRAPRVCWILHELGADSIKTAVFKDDVKKLYFRYSKRFGERQKELPDTILPTAQRQDCWKPYPLGKTQFWMNRDNISFEFNLDEYARKYVLDHPSDLEGFIKRAEFDGYSRLYKRPSSIPDAFYRMGGRVDKRKLRDMSGGRTNYSENEKAERIQFARRILEEKASPMRQPDLVAEVVKNYPNLNEITFKKWIQLNPKIFSYKEGKGRMSAIISLIGMDMSVKPMTYRQKVKEEAVKYLMEIKDHIAQKIAIYSHFSKDIPEGINKDSAISAIFGDKELFIRDDKTIRLTDFVINEEKSKSPSISDTLQPRPYVLDKLYKPSYEWESLKPLLFKELHAEFRVDPSFDLNKHLDRMYNIMAMGESKIPHNSIFHDLLSAIPDFFNKVLADDRKRSLRDNCDKCLEPFMKSFYSLKYNSDLVSDVIHDFHLKDNGAGLGQICSYFEKNLMILPYQDFVPKDGLEYYIKRCINESKSKRNIEIGHAGYYIDTSDHSVMNRLCDVISVFVYLASKL